MRNKWVITTLAFADDLVPFSSSMRRIRRNLEILESFCQLTGLRVCMLAMYEWKCRTDSRCHNKIWGRPRHSAEGRESCPLLVDCVSYSSYGRHGEGEGHGVPDRTQNCSRPKGIICKVGEPEDPSVLLGYTEGLNAWTNFIEFLHPLAGGQLVNQGVGGSHVMITGQWAVCLMAGCKLSSCGRIHGVAPRWHLMGR